MTKPQPVVADGRTHDLDATVTYLQTQRSNRLFGTVELRFQRGEIVQIILHESLKPAELSTQPENWSRTLESESRR